MHITYLALGVDALASVLMDVIDHNGGSLVEGKHRDNKLETLYNNYRVWCEASRAWISRFNQMFFDCCFGIDCKFLKTYKHETLDSMSLTSFLGQKPSRRSRQSKPTFLYKCNPPPFWWGSFPCSIPKNYVCHSVSIRYTLVFYHAVGIGLQ